MHSRFVTALLVGGCLLTAVPAQALQCVPFAREHSGISLRGDAWTWWSSAAGQYDRGQHPRSGAVVVFKRFGAMRHGHVAVVTQVVSSREVLVDHANWGSRRVGGRGKIAKNMAMVDVSPHNDWTEVRVWNAGTDDFGTRVYPTYGFIYPGDEDDDEPRTASAGPDKHPLSSSLLKEAAYSVSGDSQSSFHVDFEPLEPEQNDAKADVPAKGEAKPAAKPEVSAKADTAKSEGKAEAKPVPKMESAKAEAKPAAKSEVAKAEPAKSEPAKIVIARMDLVPAKAEPIPTKSEAAVVASPQGFSEDDLALAKRFGSGHY